ncbi:MAG: NAD-dependent deacylase [Pseudomonadota bacterium]
MAANIVVLTGAGVSAESGVSTFRDADGIWAQYDYREVATPEGFAANPALVHGFYNARRAALPHVAPNAAHRALARLESGLAEQGGRMTLVTQNVDDLHERGGASRVLHMHGELSKARCDVCGNVSSWKDDLSTELSCAQCGAVGAMRPHVVWFGEMPFFLREIEHAIADADLFVSIGTSGSVYPAAGFVAEARACNIPTLELNLEPSENAAIFDEGRYGPAGDIVPQWVEETLNGTRNGD